MVAVEENIYSLIMDLSREGADTEEARTRLHTAVDAMCDGIEYGENDE